MLGSGVKHALHFGHGEVVGLTEHVHEIGQLFRSDKWDQRCADEIDVRLPIVLELGRQCVRSEQGGLHL